MEVCKILTPKAIFIEVPSIEISNDLYSYLLRNFDLKCGNNFWDIRYLSSH